jgi:hypothetical protein
LLRDRLRTPDVLGHLGDGVFGVLLPECSAETCSAVIQRLGPVFDRELGMKLLAASFPVEDFHGPVEVIEALLARVRVGGAGEGGQGESLLG